MRHNYPAEFENLWANNNATTRKEAGYSVYLRMKKEAEKKPTPPAGSFAEVFITYVERLRNAMRSTPYEGEPVTEIGLDHAAFDRLVVSLHQSGIAEYNSFSFRPSAMHEVKICGIRIVPRRADP